jgi:diacylglycerol kinase family enzyme
LDDVILFANAIAGRGRGNAIASRLADALARSGYAVRAFLESPDKVPLDQIRGKRSPRVVVVVGGDGTLRTVAERLLQAFDAQALPPLLVVPLGTANLMAKHLGINRHHPAATAEIVTAIANPKVVYVDASRANGQLFLLMAGAGMDGHIIHELDRLRVGPIDLTHYALPVALAMQKYTYPAVTVAVDGKQIFGPEPGMVFIANAAEYGIGFPILPQARTDDALLDICAVPC